MKKLILINLILLLVFVLIGCSSDVDKNLKMDEYVPEVVNQNGAKYKDHTFFKDHLQIKIKVDSGQKLVLAHQAMQIVPETFKDKKKVNTLVLLWQKKLDEYWQKVGTLEITREQYKSINWENVSQYDLKPYIK